MNGLDPQRDWRRRHLGRRFLTLMVASGMLLGFGAAMAFIPVGFVLWSPAPPIDLYAEAERPAIEITRADVYPVTGRLLLTPVLITPADASVSLLDAVSTFLMADHGVFPREVSYPVGAPVEQVQHEGPSASRRAAIIAALRMSGYEVEPRPLITHVLTSGPAYGRLEKDDIVTEVDGIQVTTATEVNNVIKELEAGSFVQVRVLRGDVEVTVSVRVVVANDRNEGRIGIRMENNYRYDPEINLSLETQGISSASGLLLAIAVYDYLSMEDLIDGRTVAGTGVLDVSGAVSAASGLSEKLRAAADAGATIFLLPSVNCQEIAGGVPDGLKIVKVDTLAEAISSLRTLRINPDAPVPTCDVP